MLAHLGSPPWLPPCSQTGEVEPEEEGGGEGGSSGGGGGGGPAWPPSGAPVFVVSELCRQVDLGVRRADVQDYEVGGRGGGAAGGDCGALRLPLARLQGLGTPLSTYRRREARSPP
jgi:hypothetical protein